MCFFGGADRAVAAIAEFNRAIQDAQAEGESAKANALALAQDNVAKLAAKDEMISAQQVRRRLSEERARLRSSRSRRWFTRAT